MIKAVIFDLWGTLTYNKNHIGSYIQKIINIIGSENQEKFKELRKEWYVHNYSSEEFFSKLLNKVNKPAPFKDELIRIWNSQLESANLYDDTIGILESLKRKNVKLILISNTTPISNDVIKKLNIQGYFNLVFFSCNEGTLKPSPFVYQKILSKLNLKPEEVIAVGDQIETDIQGAETYGIKAVLLDRENKQDYKHKIYDLDEIEFFLK